MRTSKAWWGVCGALVSGVVCALACSSSSSNGATSTDAGGVDAAEDSSACDGSTCGEPPDIFGDSSTGLPPGTDDGGSLTNTQGLCYACLPNENTPLTCFASSAFACSTYNGPGCGNACVPHWEPNPGDAGCAMDFNCKPVPDSGVLHGGGDDAGPDGASSAEGADASDASPE